MAAVGTATHRHDPGRPADRRRDRGGRGAGLGRPLRGGAGRLGGRGRASARARSAARSCCAGPRPGRRYFSRAIGLGVVEPATAGGDRRDPRGLRRAGITMFLLQSLPHCRPAEYEAGCASAGSSRSTPRTGSSAAASRSRASARDRRPRARGRARRPRRPPRSGPSSSSASTGLDTGPWLPALIGRPGWHQYVARERRRDRRRAWHVHRPRRAPPGSAWTAPCPAS